jgi:hypothetical protein
MKQTVSTFSLWANCLAFALLIARHRVDSVVTPHFMISSLHAVTARGQLEKDLVKNEALVFLKNIHVTNDTKNFQVTKVNPKDFVDEVNSYLSEQTNSSVLFFIPDADTDLDEVFYQCETLQRSVQSTVIPCIYTKHDTAHFSIFKDVNKIADEYYIAPTLGALRSAVSKVADGIQYPLNILAHGYGARVLSRFDELKLSCKSPKFSNLFLAAPVLGADFFSQKKKKTETPPIADSAVSGVNVKKFFNHVHVFYDKDDRILQGYSKELEHESGKETDLLGSRGAPEGGLEQLNCNKISFWADPFRHHIYFNSKKCVDYINRNLETNGKSKGTKDDNGMDLADLCYSAQ